jgi:hypothetical protein
MEMERRTDLVTGEKILSVSSKKSFINAVKIKEQVIEVSGEAAKDCMSKLLSGQNMNKIGTGITAGSAALGLGLITVPAALFGVATGAVIKLFNKNMSKYEYEILSEDHIIFRLKGLKKK